MLAVDTNLVVRYLTGDHPKQSVRARRLIDAGDVYVGITVMLEAEWVLRSVYGYQPGDVCGALRAFAGLPGMAVEDETLVAMALDRVEHGMDFADALHLGKASHCEAMVTFDRKFIRAAKAVGIEAVREA
jgi:predicted nucleic-acid-binding protein